MLKMGESVRVVTCSSEKTEEKKVRQENGKNESAENQSPPQDLCTEPSELISDILTSR